MKHKLSISHQVNIFFAKIEMDKIIKDDKFFYDTQKRFTQLYKNAKCWQYLVRDICAL